MKRGERNELIRAFLADYDAMKAANPDRVSVDAANWIVLKLSCSRAQAERWIAQVLKLPPPVTRAASLRLDGKGRQLCCRPGCGRKSLRGLTTGQGLCPFHWCERTWGTPHAHRCYQDYTPAPRARVHEGDTTQ